MAFVKGWLGLASEECEETSKEKNRKRKKEEDSKGKKTSKMSKKVKPLEGPEVERKWNEGDAYKID